MTDSKARFGMQLGGTWTQDDDGNWVRIGEVPEDVKETLAKMGQKVSDKPKTQLQEEKQAEDEYPTRFAKVKRMLRFKGW